MGEQRSPYHGWQEAENVTGRGQGHDKSFKENQLSDYFLQRDKLSPAALVPSSLNTFRSTHDETIDPIHDLETPSQKYPEVYFTNPPFCVFQDK